MSIYSFEDIANKYRENNSLLSKIGNKTALKIVTKLNEFKANIKIPKELI